MSESQAAVMRSFRATHPGYTAREKRRGGARVAALEALARHYPAEFLELYDSELEKAGVGDPEMVRDCACGAEIERRSSVGRWPKRCGACRTEVQRQRNERRTKAAAA